MSEIGNRIRRLRLSQSLSQQEISSNGVSVPYISRIETGDITFPSHSALIAIGERLGVSALELETGDPEAHCSYCKRGNHVGV
jgi:transcriptional regulator with XRE-family HTH domain